MEGDAMQNYTRETQVQADGRIEVNVPLPPGSRVEVIVVTRPDENREQRATSLDDWDNLLDDAAWRSWS